MDNNPHENQQQYSFALKKIQLLEKNLSVIQKKEADADYDYDISLRITVDEQKELSIHFFSVSVKIKSDNRVLGSISILCIFDIFNFSNVRDKETGRLPQDLLNLLNTVVIGTMRGIMYSEFRGTGLDDVIFPVLDPTRFEQTTAKLV